MHGTWGPWDAELKDVLMPVKMLNERIVLYRKPTVVRLRSKTPACTANCRCPWGASKATTSNALITA